MSGWISRRLVAALASVALVATAVAACTAEQAAPPVASAATPAQTGATQPTLTPKPTLAMANLEVGITPGVTPSFVTAPPAPPTEDGVFTTDELASVCARKGGISTADAFAGTLHGVVAVDYDGEYDSSIMGAAGPAESRQLVLCAAQPTLVKTGSCGQYKRSSDGKVGYVYKYKQARTLTIYSIQTGKKVAAKTLYGASASCSQSFDIQFSNPPWKVSGGPVSDAAILAYADVLTRMKA